MMGATALHTRAPCDECGDVPATLEGVGGIIVCERCNAVPPANDDALGSLLSGMMRATPQPRSPCARCAGPAFVRVDSEIILCAGCWLNVSADLETDSNSVPSAVPPPDVKVATAALMNLCPSSAAVATNLSTIPDAELDSIVGWLERQWNPGAFGSAENSNSSSEARA